MEGKPSLTIRLDAKDNVVVARQEIAAGTEIANENITTLQVIPAGHKVAVRAIKKGEPVLKYNTVIGYAAENILPGTWMHSHNICFDEVDKDYAFSRDYKPATLVPEAERATFMGYVRKNGKVGTRNVIAVTVASNCAATVARRICYHFNEERMKKYPNVDGVIPFITGIGCGMEMTGEPMDLLRRTISGTVANPNVAGALVCALGCERNNIDRLFEAEQMQEDLMLRRLVMQEVGGTAKAIQLGIEMVEEMLAEANKATREKVSAEHLMLALQCGGSDGFSGLSANPALGKAADKLVQNGGTVVLAEISELFGVEHTLTCRAKTPEIGKKFVERLDWWLEYNDGRDCQINGKVSPGNNAGGISNVLEKSLGGAKKGGSTAVNAMYKYAERVEEKGLVIMDTPGYDPMSVTGEFAGGSTICAFTTGRGSCFGSIHCPTIKLASNTPMYEKMVGDMDINCGQIIDGEKTIDEVGNIIFERLLAVASGDKSKSEALGVGFDEYVPWPIGVMA